MKYHWKSSATILSLTCVLLVSCTSQSKRTTLTPPPIPSEVYRTLPSVPAAPWEECTCLESGWIVPPSNMSEMRSSERKKRSSPGCIKECEHSWEEHP